MLLAAMLACGWSACTSLPNTTAPREFLDERTGATVAMVDKPMIFARDRSERAANLRDYITLVAASLNRSGKIEYVWIAYAWSTLDARALARTSIDSMVMTADDRRIALRPLASTAVESGVSAPVRAPPGVSSISRVYAADLDTLRFMAAARNLRVQAANDETEPYYELWDDQRTSLASFVRYANGER
jgi:hypothetical protein